jgi:hypothetical protein
VLNEACSEAFITVLMIFSTSGGESTDVAACQRLPDDEDAAHGQDDLQRIETLTDLNGRG